MAETATKPDQRGQQIRLAIANEPTRAFLGRIIFTKGGAMETGACSERDQGKRDFARAILAEIRKYAPRQAAGLYLDYSGRPEPADMAGEADAEE